MFLREIQMRRKTVYEWDVETVDCNGDVYDHEHDDRLSGLVGDLEVSAEERARGFTKRLVLVRDVWCGRARSGRTWAYVDHDSWSLPERFEDAYGEQCAKVPKRFLQELARNKMPESRGNDDGPESIRSLLRF